MRLKVQISGGINLTFYVICSFTKIRKSYGHWHIA